MKKLKIKLVDINKLNTHEAVVKDRVNQVFESIKLSGLLINPVVVDQKTLIVLDGHHRLAALKKMKAKKIPVLLVDYKSKNIKVYLRRKELMINVIKEAVIKKGLSNQHFPPKTTKHNLSFKLKNIKLNVNQLL
ncbi:hypothetical protein COT75_04920 [Candidatus Beckwithbacteria bacterium CG10_big_fil_rev_8_21_14_0_10_34_10]|uniref:ParB-like N-terminal domain-containing protein n=1 Tax=Candidatus Beckwithbacteria bacterium CG10_big_fil_rev_8_21_14_0_10_34_10 TaxID=1974495 RepID=A0A2H0W8A2_9BACT|nr:MAG: hypothetical protein COT75_04920 [Candidatus Beckwithbacteria bacterium CG10_big_fil_rev_8_21_14_0_10_34_10]